MIRAFLFPGQGSQYKGMGKDLFSQYPAETAKASELLGYDLVDLCIHNRDNLLKRTDYTQPAIYVVSALYYFNYLKTNFPPDYLAGHSLGEYNALLASGAFDFETGLKLVKKRGELMAAASGGGMAAVIGTDVENLKRKLADGGFTGIDVANINTPKQQVIAGQQQEMDAVIKYLSMPGIRVVPLVVSAPFHSRYMQPAAAEFSVFLRQFRFQQLKIPVVANATARWYQDDSIAELLTTQINSSVQWVDSIRLLIGKQVNDYQEAGSNILTKMVQEIKEEYQAEQTHFVTYENEKSHLPDPKTTVLTSEKKAPVFLGNRDFCKEYGLKYAYVVGAMYRGIASTQMVIKLGKAGILSFLGTGGMSLPEIQNGIDAIRKDLNERQPFGMNLLHSFGDPNLEMNTVEMYMRQHIQIIEASAFMQITKALVYYRLKGLKKDKDGRLHCHNKIIAKISRPEVAEGFMKPAPERIVQQLLTEGKITNEEAAWASEIPMSFDICVEADSGGHTDAGIALVLLPAIQQVRKNMKLQHPYADPIRIGLAGGIGTPQSIACAFIMGADFVLTGSINQCTVEAGTSDAVKDLLQEMNVQDTDYAPAGDMFEMGAKVQVLKKGVLFPQRANKLHALYSQYNAVEELPKQVIEQLETKFFKKTLLEVWDETKKYYTGKGAHDELIKAEGNAKIKMVMIFKWYFGHSSNCALKGDTTRKVDFQIHTGPALGAFNQWVKGTELENWRNREVDKIAEKLMKEATILLEEKLKEIINN
jgi:trans-AT polyketide synthase/acyltransferase/oxidoreductase domain-containing protein